MTQARPSFLVVFVVACSNGPSSTGVDAAITDDAQADGPSANLDGATDTSAPDAGDSGATRSAGCGTTPPHTASFSATTTDGKGVVRDYAVLLPKPYDASVPLALTFAYHGAGGTEASSEAFGIQNAAGASAASIFVFPQGIAFQNYGVGWDDSCGGYDMVFFDHMVSDLEAHYCIDTARLFVAGFSWGCDQATALTCCRGNRIRAVSAASCTDEFSNAKDFKTYANLPCPVVSQTGIRFTHDSSGGDSAYAAPLFVTTSLLFQSWNACAPFSGTLTANTCTTYKGCANPFTECPYDKLGHATPSGWGADSWTFFSSFP
jgi:poly(3-hydroxybutyrate) depolymerase